MKRAIYLSVFGVLALCAAGLTLHAQRTTVVVVPTRDIKAGTRLQPADVEIRHMPADAVPAGAVSGAEATTGRYVAWPLTAGEPILGRSLQQQRSGGAVENGYAIPNGFRAVSLPLQPAGAVGGMLSAGDHVDVYATPLVGHQQTVASSEVPSGTGGADRAPAASLIGTNVLVLQLRSDQGQELEPPAAAGGSTVHGLNFGGGKLGSVVLAIPADESDRYASAAAAMSIFLALDVS